VPGARVISVAWRFISPRLLTSSEQLVLEEAMANPGDPIMRNLADAPRLEVNNGDGVSVKMQWFTKHRVAHSANPRLGVQSVIQRETTSLFIFFKNVYTGQVVEFKFKP
jgi:hypothetical protein